MTHNYIIYSILKIVYDIAYVSIAIDAPCMVRFTLNFLKTAAPLNTLANSLLVK